MSTMVADLLPRIERSHLWFSENVELLFCAQIASSCHRSEGSPPVEHLPIDVEGGASVLEPPDVGAQFGLAPLFGLDHRGLVHIVSGDAFALECIICRICEICITYIC